MTKYREILRLKSLGFSERNIAHSCGVSRNTVAKVVKRAVEMNLSWPLDHDMTDSVLEEMLFPKVKSATNRRMPDYDYIRRELLRNGVNKKLLWVEYCEECRMNSEEPLMYSQFCYYIQKDEVLMLSWAVMISLCHADMRLPGYLSWNVSFDGADLSAPSRKELVHTSMLCQHFKRRDDGTGICLFHSAVMPEAFLIPEEICQ